MSKESPGMTSWEFPAVKAKGWLTDGCKKDLQSFLEKLCYVLYKSSEDKIPYFFLYNTHRNQIGRL